MGTPQHTRPGPWPLLVAIWLVAAPAAGQDDPALEWVPGTQQHHPNGQVESGQLVGDRLVQQVPVRGRPEPVGFYDAGQLRWGSLAKDHRQDDFPLAAGSRFELFSSGSLRHGCLSREHPIGGVRLPAGTTFYRNSKGRPLQAYPPGEAVLFGVWIGGPSPDEREIQFFENEPEISAIAARDQRLGELAIPAGSRVYFDLQGRLRALAPTGSIRLKGIEFAREIQLDRQGRLSEGWLASPQRIGRLTFMAAQPLKFFPDGRVRQGRLAPDLPPQQFQAFRLAPGSQARFHPNGRLKQATLASDQVVGGLELRGLRDPADQNEACASIGLYFSGRLQRAYLARDQRVGQVPLAAAGPNGCRRMELGPDGGLRSGWLAERHLQARLAFRAGTRIEFHRGGRVAAGTLDEEWTRQQVSVPPGVQVRLTPRGRLVARPAGQGFSVGRFEVPAGSLLLPDPEDRIRAIRLAGRLQIRGLSLEAGDFLLLEPFGRLSGLVLGRPGSLLEVDYPRLTAFQIDPQGDLATALLPHPASLQGVPCAAEELVELHSSGQIKRAVLSSNFTLGGRNYQPGEAIELYPDGRPVRGTLSRPERVGGIELAPGDLVEDLYPDGNLRSVVLGTDREFGGLACRAGTQVVLFENHRLAMCWLTRPTILQDLLIRDQVELTPDGRLKRGFLAQVQTVGGIEYAADALALYSSGQVRWGRLAREQRIGADTYPALSLIRLDRQGAVFQAEPFAPPVEY